MADSKKSRELWSRLSVSKPSSKRPSSGLKIRLSKRRPSPPVTAPNRFSSRRRLSVMTSALKTTKNFLLEELPRVKNIGYVFAFLICLFGLAGLPITSGFVAKVYLLYALIESGLLLLPIAFLLLILFALALYYYIKIARSVATNREVIVSSKGSSLILVISALVTFLLGVIPFSLIIYCVNVFA